jgi:deoxyribodipyrimidine photo-lyase
VTSVMWFRRDLRLADNPALLEAVQDGDRQVVPLFVLDRRLWDPAGPNRRAYLNASLRDLSGRVGGLVVRRGDPVAEVVAVARAAGASTVHVTADFGPYGAQRDCSVAQALTRHGIDLVRTGSPYAVAPGRIHNRSGEPFKVFTPFSRAWRKHGWREPAHAPRGIDWQRPVRSHDLYAAGAVSRLPPAGEAAARRRWRDYLDNRLSDYATDRDRPDLDRTSRMSVHLKWGEIHPRTMLADLAECRGRAADVFHTELAWREFYADLLHHQPHSAREYLKPEFARMDYDEPGEAFTAWQDGRTGYPIVDAGMRQLRTDGWMHNRVRMIAASFLVKDLHIEWHHGARHFLHWLVDGDLASNNHSWQWVAGCGTDAAPYFRIFNPVTQGMRFDPDGTYVRRYVPELRALDADRVHQPWTCPDGVPGGYPVRIVDHAAERAEALARYRAVRISGEARGGASRND